MPEIVMGLSVPDFDLFDQRKQRVRLSAVVTTGPVLAVFYPGDFTMVCTKQLCNYRDNMSKFEDFGVKILGISPNSPEEHASFAEKYAFNFPLLSDPTKTVAKNYGCSSLFMFGGISRAVFVIDKKRNVLYRYVEPTILTRRKADELIGILKELREKSLL